jgi:alginate O-acetyltransferase complex protein AlgI
LQFNSFLYIAFLLIVLLLYWNLRSVRRQNTLLLVASYIFYGTWDWRFLSLILISTVFDYLVGRGLERIEDARRRRLLLFVSIAINLGFLGFFKYFNFFVGSAVTLLGSLGLTVNEVSLQIILPVGISFYTFQSLTYTIDIYQGKLKPTHSLLNFALFVSYFPQLAAGPIERALRLLPKIEQPRTVTVSQFESGLVLIFIGLFKKMVIADVAASMIDPVVFTRPDQFSGGEVLLAVYLFALQIYGDFSGYSDIARGSSRLLGIELMENFNQPYFSQTVSEFWRRWHISLSTWFRDYVYIPVSNSLHQRWSSRFGVYAVSVMITMLLSGLWHGANWTYVLWGGLLGVYQVISRALRGRAEGLVEHEVGLVRWSAVVFRIVLTFHLILIAWVLFRTPDIHIVPQVYGQMWAAVGGDWDAAALGMIAPVVLLYGLAFSIDLAQIAAANHSFTLRWPVLARVGAYVSMILLMVFFSVKPYVPFIYFQF